MLTYGDKIGGQSMSLDVKDTVQEQLAISTNELSRVFLESARMFRRSSGEPQIALDRVSLQVRRGESVALVGPNGAGKSTLIRILATLVSPSFGSATVAGYDVASQASKVREKIGLMASDDRSFFWPLTGLENLIFFGEMHGFNRKSAEERARQRLDEAGLSEAADRRVSGYSAGMRQRLNIARALLHDPEVLLLDEPTSNLDRASRNYVTDVIEKLKADRQRSVLVATHDAALVVAIADRTFRLEAGRLTDTRGRNAAIRYSLEIGGLPPESVRHLGDVQLNGEGQVMLALDDLGDGHALSGAISEIIAEGGEVLGIETRTSATTGLRQ